MSARDVSQFFEKLADDETLQGEVVAFAARNGYDFTSEDLLHHLGSALSDAQLDGVAGGVAKKKKPAKKREITPP